MTEIIQPVPVFDITVPRGATRVVRFFVSKDGANLDLSTPGTQLVFVAKERREDAAPVIAKSYLAVNATPILSPDPGGIAVSRIDTNADSVPDTWVADVSLGPTDTEDVEAPLLQWEMWLIDGTSQEAPCAQGTLKLSPTVFRPGA